MLDPQQPHGELRTAFYNPHEVKRRRRTSKSQFKKLEKTFNENPKPDASTRRYLAQKLSMSPRDIQVWFQNRRAKSKHTKAAASIHADKDGSANQNISHDQQPSSGQAPEDGALMMGPCANSAPLIQQNEVGLCRNKDTIASSTTGIDVFRSSHPEGVISGTPITPKYWTSQQGNLYLTRDIRPLTPLAHPEQIANSGQHHVLQTDNPMGGFRRPSYHNPAMPPILEAKVGSSSESLILDEVDLQESRVSRGTGHKRPSTLSLMRRMSMPATIGRNDESEANEWNNQLPIQSTPSPQKFQSIKNACPHPFDTSEPALAPPTLFSEPSSSNTSRTLDQTTPKQTTSGALPRVRTYPLPRRISVHETSVHLIQDGLILKGTPSLDGQSLHAIGTGALGSKAPVQRRSSVCKARSSRLSDLAMCNALPPDIVGETSITRTIATAFPVSNTPGDSHLSTMVKGSPDAIKTSSAPDKTEAAATITDKAMDLWINDNAFNRSSVAEGNVQQPVDLQLNMSTASYHPSLKREQTPSLELTGRSSSGHDNSYSVLEPAVKTTSMSATRAIPLEQQAEMKTVIKKERRRSSLKTVKSKVQSDVHLPLAQSGRSLAQHHGLASNEESLLHHWMNGTHLSMLSGKQAPTSPMDVSRDAATMGHAIQSESGHHQLNHLPHPLTVRGILDRVNITEGAHTDSIRDTRTSNMKFPTEEQGILDSQQSRRNSCPPGLIECFSSNLHIATEVPNFSNNPTFTLEEVAMLQLQQQLQVNHQYRCTDRLEAALEPTSELQHSGPQIRLCHQGPQDMLFESAQFIDTESRGFRMSSSAMSLVESHTDASIVSKSLEPLGLNSHSVLCQVQGIESAFLCGAIKGTENLENQRAESDVFLQRQTNQSREGHRHSTSQQYNLPRLQTPRMLAQQQHQIEHHAWSRALSRNASGSQLLPAKFRNQSMGRRCSEPNALNDTSDSAIQPSSFHDLASSSSDHHQLPPPQQYTQYFTDSPNHPMDTVPNRKTSNSSAPRPLHPFEASLTFEQDTVIMEPVSRVLTTSTLAIFEPGHGSSSGGPQPCLSSSLAAHLAPRAFLISPSFSLSPSLPNNHDHSHPSVSSSGKCDTGFLDPTSQMTHSSTPAPLGQLGEAPVLVRAHSLDSSTWQQPPPEFLDRFVDMNTLIPRRHSEGLTPTTWSVPTTTVSSQPVLLQYHDPNQHQYQQQQQLQQCQQVKTKSNHNQKQTHQSYTYASSSSIPNPFPPQTDLALVPADANFNSTPLKYLPTKMLGPIQPSPSLSLHTLHPSDGAQNPSGALYPGSLGLEKAVQRGLPAADIVVKGDPNIAAINHFMVLHQKFPQAIHTPARQKQQLQQ
ncbi:hypothetical protein BGX34_010671 [Mortierella sp. NVP85]|nr:hypothetical protein BGX34_010671 [Mortierella sp. NVP85]